MHPDKQLQAPEEEDCWKSWVTDMVGPSRKKGLDKNVSSKT